jgi:hypothetical protein
MAVSAHSQDNKAYGTEKFVADVTLLYGLMGNMPSDQKVITMITLIGDPDVHRTENLTKNDLYGEFVIGPSSALPKQSIRDAYKVISNRCVRTDLSRKDPSYEKEYRENVHMFENLKPELLIKFIREKIVGNVLDLKPIKVNIDDRFLAMSSHIHIANISANRIEDAFLKAKKLTQFVAKIGYCVRNGINSQTPVIVLMLTKRDLINNIIPDITNNAFIEISDDAQGIHRIQLIDNIMTCLKYKFTSNNIYNQDDVSTQYLDTLDDIFVICVTFDIDIHEQLEQPFCDLSSIYEAYVMRI